MSTAKKTIALDTATAKKTLYAALGAGTAAIEKVRTLPKRVTDLRTLDLRELPKTAKEQIVSVPARASDLAGQAKKVTEFAADRVVKTYGDLSKRGETLAKKVQRSAPTKRATAQTKTAKSKVKAAASSVKKAAEANVEAVQAAAEKAASTN